MLITLARKPLVGSVVQNCLQHGCGAINVDASRIAGGKTPAPVGHFRGSDIGATGLRGVRDGSADALGRWPANVLVTPDSVARMDTQSGIVATGTWNRQNDTAHPFGNAKNTPYETWRVAPKESPHGASRYFKQIKGD